MKSQKSSLALLAATLVIVMIGFGIVIPLMPYYITHFNASGSSLGLMMSLYSVMQFIFAPMWGRVSDRIGRKPVLLIGIAGFAFSFTAQGLSQNLFQFIAIRALAGVISSATLPTAMAFIADTTTPENRARGVGMLGAAMGLGMIFGPTLGGFLTRIHPSLPPGLAGLLQVTTDPSTGAAINLSIPFFVSALLALLAIPVVAVLLPESLPPERRVHHAAAGEKRSALLLQALSGPSGFLFLLSFLLTFALANMETVLALYGQKVFAMGPAQVGLLMGAMGVLGVIQQGAAIGPLTRKFGEPRVIVAGLVVGVLGFAALALAPTLVLYGIAAIVFNAGNALLQPSVTSLVSKRAVAGQGETMGLNQSFQSLGRAAGPLWAGFAFDLTASLAFWTGALIQLIALLASFRQFPRLAPAAASAAPAKAPAAAGTVSPARETDLS